MKWYQKDTDKLMKILILDPATNQVLNSKEIGKEFGIKTSTVLVGIHDLRKEKLLPKYNPFNQIEVFNRPWSEKEINTIRNLLNQGYKIKTIAKRFGRSYGSIQSVRNKLLKLGQVELLETRWTSKEEQALIDNFKHDKNNFTTNFKELQCLTNHSHGAVRKKIWAFRKLGILPKAIKASTPNKKVGNNFAK